MRVLHGVIKAPVGLTDPMKSNQGPGFCSECRRYWVLNGEQLLAALPSAAAADLPLMWHFLLQHHMLHPEAQAYSIKKMKAQRSFGDSSTDRFAQWGKRKLLYKTNALRQPCDP